MHLKRAISLEIEEIGETGSEWDVGHDGILLLVEEYIFFSNKSGTNENSKWWDHFLPLKMSKNHIGKTGAQRAFFLFNLRFCIEKDIKFQANELDLLLSILCNKFHLICSKKFSTMVLINKMRILNKKTKGKNWFFPNFQFFNPFG